MGKWGGTAMKRTISILLCCFLILSLALPVRASGGVPQEVMESTKSVVRILSKYYNGSATGSGFVIKNESGEVLIATNDHVVEGNPYSISIWVGEDRMVDAEIVFTTSEKDLCVLKVTDAVDMKPLKLSKEEPQHGAAIYVVGYPGAGDILSDTQAHTSDSVTITDGIISAIRTFTIEKGGSPVKLLQVNAAINSGNSGGPLFNSEGVVIGVNTYKVNADSQGVFGSVDISELWCLLGQYNIDIPEETEVVEAEVEEATEEFSFLLPALVCAGAVCLLLVILLARRKKRTAYQVNRKDPRVRTVTLQAHMEKHPQGLGIGGAVSLLLPVAVQLRNLHNDGKLHLQICPENILIGTDGAFLKEPSSQETGRFNSGFAAPEIYRGAGFGITSDIYSFAAVLLYAATGRVPANSLQQEALEQDFAVLEDTAFTAIIRKAMASNVLDRTQSMQELIYSTAVYKAPAQRETVPVSEQPAEDGPASVKTEKTWKGSKLLLPMGAVLACGIVAVMFLPKSNESSENRLSVISQETVSTEAVQETTPQTTFPPSAEELAYAEAEKLLADGETAKAAIAFGKLAGYSDARERSIAPWNEVAVRDTVITSSRNTIGVKKDGTVLYAGSNEIGWANAKKDLESWTDIIAIDSGDGWSGYVVGLKSDGTVIARNEYFSEVKNWQDIVSVSAAPGCALGLKMDGTVEATSESNDTDFFSWVQEIAEWTDIITVRAHRLYAMGLRSDGTVVIAGNRDYKPILQIQEEVKTWLDIVAIGTGKNHNSDPVMGLKSDGTVVCAGNNFFDQCDVTDWTDIVKIRTCRTHTVGIRSDGTLVTAGSNRDGGISVGPEKPGWDSVVDVSVYDYYTVGIRSDGTVVGTGNKNYGKLNIQDWTDIALPGELKMVGMPRS